MSTPPPPIFGKCPTRNLWLPPDEDHEQFETLEVPETAEDWYLTAFRGAVINISYGGGYDYTFF